MTRSMLRKDQDGAATAVMVVFLLVVVSFALAVAMTMAASDATDSAYERDAIEALSLGESGMERAIRRLADGTPCTSLAEGAIAFGARGSFTVVGGYTTDFDGLPLAADLCRIRTQGTVSDSSTTRTIESIVKFTTVTRGFAVGENGKALQWDGSSWNSVNTGTGRYLMGVFCDMADDCWAVGDEGKIIHWDGSSWSSTSSGTTRMFRGVACQPVAPFYCFAVGDNGTIRRWNGTSWSSISSGTNRDLRDVTCPSTVCYSVGSNGNIRRYDGSSWSNDHSGTGITLRAIECITETDCWAVGSETSNNFRFVRRTSSWSTVSVSSSNSTDLEGVACITSSDCWAVGKNKNSTFAFLHWDGWSWSYQPLSGGEENLNDISCLANGECWAVGKAGKIFYLNGTWNSQASGTNDPLESVHIPTVQARLLNWREIVP